MCEALRIYKRDFTDKNNMKISLHNVKLITTIRILWEGEKKQIGKSEPKKPPQSDQKLYT